MKVITARNVNDAYAQGVDMFADLISRQDPMGSRAGEVVEADGPVATLYTHPMERVLWDVTRDCNPFFHLYESLWMLAGRNDVAGLHHFNKRMQTFSDDGDVFHGAYGFRWRHWFGFDQLNELVSHLTAHPDSRRAMLTMWSPNGDLISSEGAGGHAMKDLPCNLMIKFERRKGPLDMTVFNRSNDMIWGAYGANSVHMSFLQEYIAARLGINVGRYWQVSANFHIYTDVWKQKVRPDLIVDSDLYGGIFHPWPMVSDPVEARNLDADIEAALARQPGSNDFFNHVAVPMFEAWDLWQAGNRAKALVHIGRQMQDVDWIHAGRVWMERRVK